MDIFITFNHTAVRKFDGFGGTLKTAIACLNTGPPCVVVEMDGHCFYLAVARLHNMCRIIYGDSILLQNSSSKILEEIELCPNQSGLSTSNAECDISNDKDTHVD